MKKSRLQVMFEFASTLRQIRASRKKESQNSSTTKGNSVKAVISLLFFLWVHSSVQATNYWSRTSGGNWGTNATWSTVGYGNPVNTGSFPQAGDVVYIGNGYTIYINANAACATLNIGQGTSGILEYRSTANFSLTVSGNITVNTGARFRYNTAVNRTHACVVGGNFDNYGTVDFYMAVNQVVNVIFSGTTNSSVSGTGTWDLNTVSLNKSVTINTWLTVQTNLFEAGIKSFTGTYGTYIHNNAGAYNINPTAATFTIGPNMVYKVPQGTMWFASVATTLLLQGSLYVNGGNVFVGTTAGTAGIQSDQNGTFIPYLEVSSGTLTVYGGITYGGASLLEPMSFKMTGGTIILNSGTTGTNRQVFYVNDRAGSIFDMSAGTIIIQKPNITGSGVIDFSVCGTNGTVTSTGGLVQFGNGVTLAAVTFNFQPFANVVQPNFRITGNAARAFTLRPSSGATANFKLLSLYIDVNKTFDIRSIAGAFGDGKTMTLTSTANGVDALYNSGTFTARSSTVTFNPTGAQAIGGASVTTFYNLSINNGNHITLNRAANVSNYLSMVNGKLFTTNAFILTCQSLANASLGSVSSFVDGPMVQTVATAATTSKVYPIGKGASYRPVVMTVTHTDNVSVTYRSEIFNSAASALPFSMPPTIQNVSNVRYARFTRQNVANFSSGKMQMYYDTDDGVADKTTLLVAHDNGIAQWQNFGGTATANWTGDITSATFNNFHTYFALGNPPGGGNPLPIELTTFNAKLLNKKVFLSWATQTEVNNSYFTLERSANNTDFTPIGQVSGAGTTSTSHNYSFTDDQPINGISYYRLRQTDYDGNTTAFRSALVRNLPRGEFLVYPNPASKNVVHLNYVDGQEEFYAVTVQDVTGRVIPAQTIVEEEGNVRLEFDKTVLHPGSMYIITSTDGTNSYKQKLIIE